MDKKKVKHVLAGLGLTAAAFSASSYLYLRLVKNKSLSTWVVNRFIEYQEWKKKSEELVNENIDQAISTLIEENRKAVKNPFAFLFKNHQEYILDGMQIFVWNDQEDSQQDSLIYLHGGGYIWQPFNTQYLAMDQIAKKTNAKIVMPIYPKKPLNTILRMPFLS